MIAIKIDVIKKEIYAVEMTQDYKEIYHQLECELFTCISARTIAPGDSIYVDDEGLRKEFPIGAFSIRGINQVLSGHGLVIGTDSEGKSISCVTPLAVIKQLVRFEDTHYLPKPGFTITSF